MTLYTSNQIHVRSKERFANTGLLLGLNYFISGNFFYRISFQFCHLALKLCQITNTLTQLRRTVLPVIIIWTSILFSNLGMILNFYYF